MPKISITLILFSVLCLLSVNLWSKRRDNPAATPFLILTVLGAIQALLVSLRWDFGITQFRVFHVLLAAAMPGVAWLCFQAATSGGVAPNGRTLVHVTPPLLIGLALAVLPDAIDFILIAAFVFYAQLFMRLAMSAESRFDQTAFEGLFDMRRAAWLLGFTLLGSACVDVLVFLDFLQVGGQHASQLIGFGNMAWLLALGASVALGSNALPSRDDDQVLEQAVLPDPEDHVVAEQIGQLLNTSGLALDPGLTLSRLARRARLPIRVVSNAINRIHGRNVSQFINDARIAEACRLLRDSEISITQAIYASGFQTKSNFNREFLRVTGKTPREWRRSLTSPP